MDGPTIQDAIEKRLSSLLRAPIAIAAAGRTDAGVHARGQIVHFDVPARAVSTGALSQLLAPPEASPLMQCRLRVYTLTDMSLRRFETMSYGWDTRR